MTAVGRDHIRQFVKNGGSYVGTCAGAFLGSIAPVNDENDLQPYESYIAVWPGYTMETHLFDAYTGIFVEKNSPLLKYYDFGDDLYIDSLRHFNGCYAYTTNNYPKETESLIRFDCDTANIKKSIHNQTVAWAYKENAHTGRVILSGSHPEKAVSGEVLDLMASFLRYCMDGNGDPIVKGELINRQTRKMNRKTEDNTPAYTRIGDKQYHHFTVFIPANTSKVTITLSEIDGWSDFDMFLFVDNKDFAFADKARYHNVDLGVSKSITISNPQPGKYYISVFLATTVEAVETHYGTQYVGRTDVLNGVPYQITCSFE